MMQIKMEIILTICNMVCTMSTLIFLELSVVNSGDWAWSQSKGTWIGQDHFHIHLQRISWLYASCLGLKSKILLVLYNVLTPLKHQFRSG